MATSKDYIEFVLEQVKDFGDVTARKMFGEYMVYFSSNPILLVCDNTVFIKILPDTSKIMENAERGFPYDGAKEHYILDIENRELLGKIIPVLIEITPLPKRKRKA